MSAIYIYPFSAPSLSNTLIVPCMVQVGAAVDSSNEWWTSHLLCRVSVTLLKVLPMPSSFSSSLRPIGGGWYRALPDVVGLLVVLNLVLTLTSHTHRDSIQSGSRLWPLYLLNLTVNCCMHRERAWASIKTTSLVLRPIQETEKRVYFSYLSNQ